MADPKIYGGYPHKLPSDATPVSGSTATAITTTTGVDVANFAAPGAGSRFYITQALALNHTTAEPAMINIVDSAGKVYATIPAHNVVDAIAEGAPEPTRFEPPLRIDENVKLQGIGVEATLGDTFLTLNGFSGTTANEPSSV